MALLYLMLQLIWWCDITKFLNGKPKEWRICAKHNTIDIHRLWFFGKFQHFLYNFFLCIPIVQQSHWGTLLSFVKLIPYAGWTTLGSTMIKFLSQDFCWIFKKVSNFEMLKVLGKFSSKIITSCCSFFQVISSKEMHRKILYQNF